MTQYDYDLFVIGAGSGGVFARHGLRQGYGAKVAVAEEYRVGGTCVIRGCVPKKLFVYASQYSKHFKDSAGFGWSADEPTFDWPTLVAHKDAEIERLNGIYIRNLEAAGVEIIHARAEFEDPHTLQLVGENRTVTAEKILVAPRCRPVCAAQCARRNLCHYIQRGVPHRGTARKHCGYWRRLHCG